MKVFSGSLFSLKNAEWAVWNFVAVTIYNRPKEKLNFYKPVEKILLTEKKIVTLQ
jgi:hypothetical protein